MGKKLLVLPTTPPPGSAQTPVAAKQGRATPVLVDGSGGGLSCATPPVMCVPGATISGLARPSAHGPRLEKSIISFALSAPVSGSPQPSLPAESSPPLAGVIDWTFSAAPIVNTFFPAAGEPTLPAPEPALPAAKTITIS